MLFHWLDITCVTGHALKQLKCYLAGCVTGHVLKEHNVVKCYSAIC